MADHVLDEAQDSSSQVSGLSSLSASDAFEQQLIQQARDEQRRMQARTGNAHVFRKARTQPGVALTLANLARNEAHSSSTSNNINSNININSSHARPAVKSPPSNSSSGSMRSDPAIHAPASWGRKGRTSRGWLRSITRDEQPATGGDSPLSHKSGGHGDAAKEHSGEWDLTFDMNEASMLVSTPYVPRNTRLDDIREREVESQAKLIDTSAVRKSVETASAADRPPVWPVTNRRSDDLLRRLGRQLSNTPSPKETRAARPITTHAPPDVSYTKPHERKELEIPPVHNAPTLQEQPPREQRHDTPHDGARPDVSAPTAVPLTHTPDVSSAPTTDAPSTHTHHDPSPHSPRVPSTHSPDAPSTHTPHLPSAPTPNSVHTTPPSQRPTLHPKTPYVMGGWVDTPGPRTAHRAAEQRPRSPSPTTTPRSKHPPAPPTAPTEAQPSDAAPAPTHPSPPRPQLPGSALHALVQEARANHDYGDDTLHSLEDLMTPTVDNEVEEDTLQGLTLPTSAPRSEAERGRQAEIVDLHRLAQRLRSTSTSLRDTSRGLRRFSSTVEHIEVDGTSGKAPLLVRDLSHEFSPWAWFRSFFWDERLRTQRQQNNAALQMWGGVTLLGILLTLSFIWWASETLACEMFCHPEYASYSPYPFAVNMDAPKRGVVIPTLVYRALFRNWSTPVVSPIASLSSWIWTSLWGFVSRVNITGLSRSWPEVPLNGGPAMPAHTQPSWKVQEEVQEEDTWEWSMAEDEVLRR